MKIYEIIKTAEDKLRKAGIEEAVSDTWILFEEIFKMNRSTYIIRKMEEFPNNEENNSLIRLFNKYIKERCSKKPVQYIIGKWNFMGLDFEVNENVLIPRFDTECLVEKTIETISEIRKEGHNSKDLDIKILDMCTGSGCIAISIKKFSENVGLTAVDISQKALDVAKKNAILHDVDIDFILSDMFNHIDNNLKFDILISNPPYIKTQDIKSLMPEVKSFEPLMALDGDTNGLKFYKILVDKGSHYIRNGGYILFEIGCEQGQEVKKMLEDSGYTQIKIIKDLAGLDRVVKAKRIK